MDTNAYLMVSAPANIPTCY